MMLASLPLWSPFALIGIAPLMLLPATLAIRQGTWSQLRLAHLLPAVAVLLIASRYLTLDLSHMPSEWTLPKVGSPTAFIIVYTIFIAVEFLVLALVLWQFQPSSPLFVSIVILLLLPFRSFGPSNDLVMRASIPALTILCATALLCFDREILKTNRIAALALVITLALGAETAIHEIIRALAVERWQPNNEHSFLDTQHGIPPVHYVGQLNQAGMIWLLKEPKPNRLLLKSDFGDTVGVTNGNAKKPNE